MFRFIIKFLCFFISRLGADSYYPPGAPHVSDNWLFGMYHSNMPVHNKDVILRSMLVEDGIMRIVFATVALGMGKNFAGIHSTIY